MIIQGKCHTFGNDIDTDAIIPARYLNTTDAGELARHCMEDADPTFAGRVRAGEIIVAGKNFGCGSSREHAPVAIKAAGVAAVIAASFARIFYRNAINIGLPIFESPAAAAGIQAGDEVKIDAEKGEIVNLTRGATYPVAPFPPFMQELITAGGLMPYVARKVKTGV
ncbi:3-isopropylmalate dehydratase small subunit [Moorella naiadis]|uniref:3-isopropylmalate dehydratase small subunit n=1 Tax=Moorella naiadis (nom. illeg.) TaxID=3093670 RepID=UPI003D9CB2F2